MGVNPDSVINSIAVSLGPTIAVGVGAFINWRATKMAERAAVAAQTATAQAARDASKAQEATSRAAAQASEAARQLIITARASDNKLDQIHGIVNSQRTEMIIKIDVLQGELRRLLAKYEPIDELKNSGV